MGWSVEAIIALVTLLVTGPASLLVLWNHFKNRNRQCLRGEYLVTYYKSETPKKVNLGPYRSTTLSSHAPMDADTNEYRV
jgi:hypothetical protein